MHCPLTEELTGHPLNGFTFAQHWICSSGEARNFLPWPDQRKPAAANPFVAWSPNEVQELEEWNRGMGNVHGAELAHHLAGGDCLAVVTGQQPNLFASPMYVLYKALGVLHHARRLAKELGRTVIPIYWVASDDHDFQELRDCRILASAGEIENLGELITTGVERSAPPAFEWNLDGSAERLQEAVNRHMGGLPGHRLVESIVKEALHAPSAFEAVFCRTLLRLLPEDTGLLFVAPRLKALRKRQRQILIRDVAAHPETARLLEERGVKMAAAGYQVPIRRAADQLNFFYFLEGSRSRVTISGESAVIQRVPDGRILREISTAELLKEIRQYPELFSPNVVTRPLLQDSALPTLLYVAGPGEAAYLAQLQPVYEIHNLKAAGIVPRPFVTIVDEASTRFLDSIELPGNTFDQLAAQIQASLLKSDPTIGAVLESVTRLESNMTHGMNDLRQTRTGAHEHMQKALEKTAHTIQFALNQLRSRLSRHLVASGSAEWAQFLNVRHFLSPSGHAQERILSPLSVLARTNNPGIAGEIVSRLDWENPSPQIVQVTTFPAPQA